jgi:NTE family protein
MLAGALPATRSCQFRRLARVFDFLMGNGRNGDRAAAAVSAAEQPPRTRPTIGLALGGGAARGFAHIGILRTLIAKGFMPDVIAGTSIGAVAGGLYAAGHLDSLEEWARTLTRRSVFGYLDFSFSGSGLIRGDRLAERLDKDVGQFSIEELPLRFAAIATEVGTGHEIWLTRGRLVDGLRAAYALPGVFTPVLIGHRWLVDGALVNPVPVSAARALGARLVIAVNLNADLFGRGTTIAGYGPDEPDEGWLRQVRARHGVEPGPADAARLMKRQVFGTSSRPGFSTVMIEAFNIMQDRITRARLAGDPPDITVNPRLGDIGLFDFHRAAESIERGAEAAEKALAPIEEALAALA